MSSGEAVRNGHKCPQKRRWAFSGVCVYSNGKGALKGCLKALCVALTKGA